MRDKGHEVVGNAIGVLAHGAANVRAHGVEVAQDGHLPQVRILGVCGLQVAQYVFAHKFGAGVGAGHLQAAVFFNWHGVGVAIHGGRRAKHNAPHIGPVHGLQQGQGAAHVVVKVPKGLSHRFAYGLEAGKVNHAFYGVGFENGV